MREITVPENAIRRSVHGPFSGTHLLVPVEVNWPELALTEEQVMANAIAMANGQPMPFPNKQIFALKLPFIR